MAAKTTLTRDQCDNFFSPALGAFFMSTMRFSHMIDMRGGHPGIPGTVSLHLDKEYRSAATDLGEQFLRRYITSRISYTSQSPIIDDTPRDSIPSPPLGYNRDYVRSQIYHSLEISAVASLGMACFGYIFERYKKTARQDEIGPAFGLGALDNQANFNRQFQTARVTTWIPNSTSYWFSSMIRNAFSHGQWEIIDGSIIDIRSGPPTRVRLWNVGPGGRTTFDITMELSDLRLLVFVALFKFIEYVQPPNTDLFIEGKDDPKSHEILYTILNSEMEDMNFDFLTR